MTDIEKRKLFRKRWLWAFISPLCRVNHYVLLETGVGLYDINDKSMRNVYSSFKIVNVAYPMVLFFFIGAADNTYGAPYRIDHPLLLGTLFIPLYFILCWAQHTFFLAAFAIDGTDKAGKGEVIDNLQTKWILQICFAAWVVVETVGKLIFSPK